MSDYSFIIIFIEQLRLKKDISKGNLVFAMFFTNYHHHLLINLIYKEY